MSSDASGWASSPRTIERRLVRVLLQTAQAVLRSRRIGASAVVLHDAEAALRTAFGPVWERLARLDLEIGPEAITLDGAPVLGREDDAEGLMAALTGAGIRRLVFDPGAELEEVELLLAAVDAARRPAERAPDLATSLFRADLHHIRYELDEVGADSSRPGDAEPPEPEPARIEPGSPQRRPSPEDVREAVRRDAATAADAQVVRLEDFDSTLYFLDQREIEYLKSAIDREYSQDLALNALSVLLDVLELRPEPEVRDEVVGILSDFLPELLGAGRFEAVAQLVAGVREASRSAVELKDAQKQALDRLRANISRPGALSQLFHALEAGAVAPSRQSMDVLLRELRPDAVREVLTWGDCLSNAQTRTAVVGALDEFFTEWPHSLSRMLDSSDRDVVLAGLDLAARLKLPEFAEIVAPVASHSDARVRRRLAETFSSLQSAEAFRRLLGMADDEDRDVRIVVYRAFAARPFRGAYRALHRAITEGEVEEKGQREKRILFEAFAAVAGSEGLTLLEPLLRGKNPFGRRPSPHTRACAAAGLGIIGTPAARAALESAAEDRDPLVRSAVRAALRGER